MKLEHLKEVCIFSTYASCFVVVGFFSCTVFSYIYFLKPATIKTEAIFVPVHILRSSQNSVSVSQGSCSHHWGGCSTPEELHSIFCSVTVQENVTKHPVTWYFLLISHELHQMVCFWQYLQRNCNAAKTGTLEKLGKS